MKNLQFLSKILTLIKVCDGNLLELRTAEDGREAVVRRYSVKKVFLKVSQNSREGICARVSFSNKVAGLRPATLLKKRLWHRCFLVNFVKFLRTPFFIEHLWWLLLIVQYLRSYITRKGILNSNEFKKILSMRVLEFFVNLVGFKM